MTDYYEYTMAALGSKGAVFACPYRGEKQTSVLFFKPFEAWAAKSEWSLDMPGNEEVGLISFVRVDFRKSCLDRYIGRAPDMYSASDAFFSCSLSRSSV